MRKLGRLVRGCARPAKRVDRDVRRDREHPSPQVLAVLEATVGGERPQKGLLEGVLGSLRAEPAPQQREHDVGVLA